MDAYLRKRTSYQDISGNATIATGDGDTTFVSARSAKFTLFIQRLIVHVETSAAQSASFEDSNSTPKQIAYIPSAPGVGDFTWDFGALGISLTAGKNFLVNVSAAGLKMHVVWEGYQRATSTLEFSDAA